MLFDSLNEMWLASSRKSISNNKPNSVVDVPEWLTA